MGVWAVKRSNRGKTLTGTRMKLGLTDSILKKENPEVSQ